jgi:hypothetical protein
MPRTHIARISHAHCTHIARISSTKDLTAEQQSPSLRYDGRHRSAKLTLCIFIAMTAYASEASTAREHNGQTESSPPVTQIQTTFEYTTFLTKLNHPVTPTPLTSIICQSMDSSSVFIGVTGKATSTESEEQLGYSKAQLVVAILTLCGVGKLLEQLGKVVWTKVGA